MHIHKLNNSKLCYYHIIACSLEEQIQGHAHIIYSYIYVAKAKDLVYTYVAN